MSTPGLRIITIFKTDFISFTARSVVIELKFFNFGFFLFFLWTSGFIYDLDDSVDEENKEEH